MRLFTAVIWFLFLVPSLHAQHPKVVVPAGQFVDQKIEVPKDVAIIWDISPLPVQEATGLEDGRIIFIGEPGKTYVATAFKVDFVNKKVSKDRYEYTFAGTAPPKKPDDPVIPPPGPTTGYFMVIRPDGNSHPSFTAVMELPGWDELRSKGHYVKDFEISRARKLGAVIPADVTLPCVITLARTPGGKEKQVAGKPVSIPTTNEAIAKLPETLK